MRHSDQVLALLRTQIGNPEEVDDISATAREVAAKWVDPLTGGRETTNGLIYGLVQSGKTGVLTVTGAIGVDTGYRTVVILTSDNDALYEQTLGRVQEAFPGVDILAKSDFKDRDAFLQRVKGGTAAIVTTKNAALLQTLIDNFRHGRVRGLTCLMIDDEADQASLNTRASRADGSRSAINDRIVELRQFFDKNTYLQVTATPQALFLQTPRHDFRPRFTVLSHPGAEYVGGDDFFGVGSSLVREFGISDIAALAPGNQPSPGLHLPKSLTLALDTFMMGATFKRTRDADQNCAFLCHVSTRTADHRHIVDLLRHYKQELATALRRKDRRTIARLEAAYSDLAATHAGLRGASFTDLLEAIEFFSPGIAVKLVNGDTDDDVAVRSPYNLFVGGNKLGRGVTIKNLLVSYYGRNPRQPQADTVLQHARMYGYRRRDIGLLRLFLPAQLNIVFKAIHQMERGLRELVSTNPGEEFRGVYVDQGVNPTRRNILAPGSIGVYSGGSSYNPSQVLRTPAVTPNTAKIDRLLSSIANKDYAEIPLGDLGQLVALTTADDSLSERVWNAGAIAKSIQQFGFLRSHTTGYVYVARDRDLQASRHETQGILEGGEGARVPQDKLTLFLLRTPDKGHRIAAWWPQVRFPTGRYAFAFAM